jgi:hypothetical protein
MLDHGTLGIVLIAVVIVARVALQRGLRSRRRRGG